MTNKELIAKLIYRVLKKELSVREALEKEGIAMASAEVTKLPQNYVTLTEEQDIILMQRILDLLDEDDDVQEVYHNWDE